jgi:hypothetical protein
VMLKKFLTNVDASLLPWALLALSGSDKT